MEHDHDGRGRHQRGILFGLAVRLSDVLQRSVQRDHVAGQYVELVFLELLLHDGFLFGSHRHAAAALAVSAALFAHGRHRFPALQQVTGIRGVVRGAAVVVPVVLETVERVVPYRAPSHPPGGGRVERRRRGQRRRRRFVGVFRLAVGPDAVGVVHQQRDVDEYPQQRRGYDYLARVQAKLAAEHRRGRGVRGGTTGEERQSLGMYEVLLLITAPAIS